MNQIFKIYKFRTMVGQNNQAKFASDEASRITPFGQFLRSSRIDELPQTFNVLLGHMSFIGPRPEQESFVREYSYSVPYYNERHIVRPGISGLAQVEFGYTSDAEGTKHKLEYDLRYMRRIGFKMELYIIWRTIVTIFTGFGAK